MIVTIILVILCCMLAVGVVVLCAPLALRLSFSAEGLQVKGGGVASFLHPGVLSVAIDLTGKTSRITVLGRKWGSKKEAEDATDVSTGATEKIPPAKEPEVLPISPVEDPVKAVDAVPEEHAELPEQPGEELPAVETVEATPVLESPRAVHASPVE